MPLTLRHRGPSRLVGGVISLAFGILACGVLPLQARLGESVEQCTKRYGSPVKTSPGLSPIEKEIRYLYKDWRITAQAIGGQVVEIAYLRLPSQPVFTPGDIQAILKDEKGGSEWDDNSSENLRQIWRRRSDLAQAILHDGRTFVLTSYELQQLENKLEREREKQAR